MCGSADSVVAIIDDWTHCIHDMRPRAISTIVVNWSYYSAVAVCHESYNIFTIAGISYNS